MKFQIIHELKKVPVRWQERVSQTRIKVDHDGTRAVVIIANDGWVFDKGEYPNIDRNFNRWGGHETKGKQVRLSMNSPLRMTWSEWQDLVEQVDRAYETLDQLPPF